MVTSISTNVTTLPARSLGAAVLEALLVGTLVRGSSGRPARRQ